MTKLFITIALFIATGVAGFLYLKPQWQTFRTAQAENNYLTRVSGEFDELIKNRDALLREVNSISKEDIDRIDAALPQGQHAGEFLVTLENMTKETSITLKQLNLSGISEKEQKTLAVKNQPIPTGALKSSAPEKAISELPSTLSVSGSYETFKRFLDAAERNIRLIDIGTASFTSPGESYKPMDINMGIKTYYQ
ncbi:MAG: hypothetical protein G01um101433_142 [Parcubacteria group bacterium Gr01-1014_33]|nr:MAG: hypothetical protein G01um101433_142 [Parcubacteria group bacterium Gr01-1014_33]